MTSQMVRENQEGTVKEGIMVVSQDGDGFRVFAATDPSKVYQVSGSPDAPVCSCTEFRWRRNQPAYRCDHIQAVFRELGGDDGSRADAPPQTSMPSVTGPGEPPQAMEVNPNDLGPSGQMTLKRSVSTDGRIDSLSVEFTQDLGELTTQSAMAEAAGVIAIQEQIVRRFLGHAGNGKGRANGNGRAYADNQATAGQPVSADGSVAAQMLDIGGMNTRMGWRTFINVKVNGNTLKLFGTQKDLAAHLVAAGYPVQSNNVTKGVSLNLPCRAIVQPSKDGKYLNIERVLPVDPQAGQEVPF